MSNPLQRISLCYGSPVEGLMAEIVMKLLDEADRTLDSDRQAARSSILRAVAILTGASENVPKTTNEKPVRGGLARWQVRRVTEHVETHLDQAIRVEDLTAITHLSSSYFTSAFRRSFGVTPHAYLINRRIEQAQTLMLTTDDPLSQIALACGLHDQAHLSHLFRRVTNMSPNAWRRQNREQTAADLAA